MQLLSSFLLACLAYLPLCIVKFPILVRLTNINVVVRLWRNFLDNLDYLLCSGPNNIKYIQLGIICYLNSLLTLSNA